MGHGFEVSAYFFFLSHLSEGFQVSKAQHGDFVSLPFPDVVVFL